ncbi:hypothetical protein PG994_006005 [Apiospora phragmitis]|uniref:Uncharacterized protein n=1 Tax=Apiospora phragmitis TaxID=2905665 RepID=A0ABR1VDU7_9PEZI
MDGFIVVKLLGNTSFNGKNISTLRTSEIDGAHGLIPTQLPASTARGIPEYPDHEQFYGPWVYILYACVIIVPLVAWGVSAFRKMYVDYRHLARVASDRAPTPPPEHEGDIELQPVGGNGPAAPPAANNPIPAVPLQEWEASTWEQVVVIFFLCLWKGVQLGIMIAMIWFQSQLLPWLQSDELLTCMRPRWGMHPLNNAILFITFGTWCLLVTLVSTAVRKAATVFTMRRNSSYGNIHEFADDALWFRKVRGQCIWISDVLAFTFAVLNHLLLPLRRRQATQGPNDVHVCVLAA